jgi:hypothetical protein
MNSHSPRLRRRTSCAVALCCLAFAAARVGAQNPWCVDLNEAAPATSTFDVPFFGLLSMRFTPSGTVTSNVVEVLGGATFGHGLSVAVRWVDPQTGAATDPPIATAELGGVFAPPSGWQSAAWTNIVALNPPDVYQLDFSAVPSLFTFPASYPLVTFPLSTGDPTTAPNPLNYDFACFTALCAGAPTTGVLAPKVRFYGGSCGLPGLATSYVIGEACQAAGPSASLQCLPPPIPGLNSTILVGATGAAGTAVFVFWSLGVESTGSVTVGPTGCPIYLDLPTLDALNAIGLQPLAAGGATGFSFTGFSIDWPNVPAFVGIVLGMQAVIVDANGLPTFVPGLSLRTSHALRLTVGY